MLRFFAIKFKVTYPFLLPQDVPADRVATIRSAFDETMKDRGFIEDMRKSNMTLRPVKGVEVTRLIRETYAPPEPILERLRSAVMP